MILLLAATALAAPVDPSRVCGTSPRLADRPDGWTSPARALPAFRDTGPKEVRDAFGAFDTHETENFAIKWGAMSGFDEADVAALGLALEHAWTVEVTELGYPPPLQTAAYKFNVYLGDTGEGTPSALGNAGYYWYDDDGYPMIVLSGRDVDDRDWVALTGAHELFHAVQDAAGMFEWGPRSDWFVEASAVWVEGQVWPEDPDQAYFLYWFAIRPELQLTFYEYPEDGNPEEYHQYGAFIFLQHLEENVGGVDLIHDVVTGTPAAGDPLETLSLLLADDTTFDEVFADFVGRNATWDYAHEDWYDDLIASFGGWSGDSHRPTGILSEDTPGWIEVPADLPRTWGANYWRLRGLEGQATVRFDGALAGVDAPRAWSVQVAVQQGAAHRRVPMTLVDGVGSLTGDAIGAYDEAWLVVAPMHELRSIRTWTYAVAFEPAVPDPEEEPRACGCAAGSSPTGTLPWILAALWARRRPTHRSTHASTAVLPAP